MKSTFIDFDQHSEYRTKKQPNILFDALEDD